MGQKTDRIKALEGELQANKQLLRHIGDTLGVELEVADATDVAIAGKRFLDALRARQGGSDLPLAAPTARRRPRSTAPGSWDTHDEEVDEQIDRLEKQGLTQPRESGGALVRRDTDGDRDFAPLLADLAPTILAIASELGLNVAESRHDEALATIHEEIVRIKSMGADVEAESGSKFLSAGKSLGEAIAHDHAQAAELRDGATQARAIVARLAAVMQIGTWDKDGTELLERAQRWEGWKYHLMQRVKALRSAPEHKAHAPERGTYEAVAVELQRQLDRLLSPKELQNWLKALEKAGAAVKVDAGPPVPPYPFEFRPSDGGVIGRAIDESLSLDPDPPAPALRERLIEMSKVFDGIGNSQVSAEEFARTMNLVILPILARQRAAQKVPGDEG
jgi:hypothetical protein